MAEPAADRRAHLPPLAVDRGFWSAIGTQFLGAFNDNLFKQLILLLCVDYAARSAGGDIYQPAAQMIFSLPFLLFSGFAGFLSDRYSKRTIFVLCKVAEIAVMVAGLIAFFAGGIIAPLCVLFFMGTQSAFFGPAKYGILPEMLRDRDLPLANGIIQMTTFLAIIFGQASAGVSKLWLGDTLWKISLGCIIIAGLGTLTSLFVRKTPIAQPDLKFTPSSLGINRATWNLLRTDRPLLTVLMISSLFWFVGGVVSQTINVFGKLQLRIGDARTSLLLSCVGIGIAIGCALAGFLSRSQVKFELVRIGSWGMVVALIASWGIGLTVDPAAELADVPKEGLLQMIPTSSTAELVARCLFLALGVSAGFFVVPLQVFLQARPPEDQKGRMIGAMNLINWLGILLSGGFYWLVGIALNTADHPERYGTILLAAALTLVPVALFYHPRDVKL